MHDFLLVQVAEPLHDLDGVDAHQTLVDAPKSVENLSKTAARNHLKHDVNLVVAVVLNAVLLNDVGML